MAKQATVQGLRRHNRAEVLRKVVTAQSTTRAAIASECDLSLSTVTNVVAGLMREGLVQEAGSLPSDGGRPIARIGPVATGASMIGVDVGERGVTVELFDLALRKRDGVFRELPQARERVTPQRVAWVVSEAVGGLRAANPDCARRLIGIGLGLPGIVDAGPDGRLTVFAQTLGWEPILAEQLCGGIDVPIFADNGAKTLAMAELWFGAARGVQHGVVVQVGRGIGAGVISNGRLLRGLSSSAGEWGHTKLALGGTPPPCSCGSSGCLEAYAGAAAVTRRWQQLGARVSGPEEQLLDQLIEAADRGDAVAARVLAEAVEALGVGLANLVNLFNPEQIVIGGWAGLRMFATRQHALTSLIRRYALARPAEQCRVGPSRMGDGAGALGAALLPLERLIDGPGPAAAPRELDL